MSIPTIVSADANKPTPATRHSFAVAMKKAAALPRKLREGTQAVRNDEDLLPKSPAESPDGYELRMKRTFLLGAYPEATDRLKSTIFSGGVAIEPPEPPEEEKPKPKKDAAGKVVEPRKPPLDPAVELWVRDFDNEHRSLHEWLMEALDEGFDCGLVHGLADFPPLPEGIENLEQELATGARPYATMLRGDELIQTAEIRRSSGALVPLRLNFARRVRSVSGWGETFEQRILVLHAGDPSVPDLSPGSARFARWEEFAVDKDGKVAEVADKKGSFRPHVEIPIRTLYLRRTGFMRGRPALLSVAEKVAEHLQSSSHQRYNLDYARFPKLFKKGFREEVDDPDKPKQKRVGASVAFSADAPHSDLKEVETTGAALAAGKAHLDDCKAEIQMLALKPYVKLNAVTASEAAISKDDASNLVDAWAINAERFAQELLDLFEVWRTPAGKEAKSLAVVKVNPDESLVLSPTQFEFLKFLIGDTHLLDDETTLKVAKELGALPPWVDVQEVLDRLKTQPPRLIGMPLPLGPGAQPPPQPPPPASKAVPTPPQPPA